LADGRSAIGRRAGEQKLLKFVKSIAHHEN